MEMPSVSNEPLSPREISIAANRPITRTIPSTRSPEPLHSSSFNTRKVHGISVRWIYLQGLSVITCYVLTNHQWFLLVTSILSSIFLYALDNTIVAYIIPAIANDFSSVKDLGWLSVGYGRPFSFTVKTIN
jgi:hypothetical protein